MPLLFKKLIDFCTQIVKDHDASEESYEDVDQMNH
jgi:hypothetical protein